MNEIELRCPGCGLTNLHQMQVDVFERDEDQGGIHVSVRRGSAAVDQNLAHNPSSRRQGLRIMFECEHCVEERFLLISQHKGTTFVGWAL